MGWLGATLATPAPPAAPAPPPATELLVELGRALLRDSRPEAAREAFTRALQLDPDDVTALAGRGRARGLLGDGRGEADDCARALELDPRSEAALLGLGRGLCAQGDHRGAVERYGQAADLGGDVALALGRRAECWLHLSDPERAEADATRAGELSPGDTLPLTVLGRVFYESGRYSEALAVYRRWQKIAPADLDAVQGRAAALLALGKRDEAGVAVDRLLEQDPQRSAGYVIRAQLHDEGGRPWAALEDATRGLLVARDPGHRQILYSRRAALRGRMGDKEGRSATATKGW